jgi:hypothetical protein
MNSVIDSILNDSNLAAELSETQIPGSTSTAYAFTVKFIYPMERLADMSEADQEEYRALLPHDGVISEVQGAVIDCDDGNPFNADFDPDVEVSLVALLLSDTDKLENVGRLMIVSKVGVDKRYGGRNLGVGMMERVADAVRADAIALESSPLELDEVWKRPTYDGAAARLLDYYMRNGFQRISKFPIHVLIKFLKH